MAHQPRAACGAQAGVVGPGPPADCQLAACGKQCCDGFPAIRRQEGGRRHRQQRKRRQQQQRQRGRGRGHEPAAAVLAAVTQWLPVSCATENEIGLHHRLGWKARLAMRSQQRQRSKSEQKQSDVTRDGCGCSARWVKQGTPLKLVGRARQSAERLAKSGGVQRAAAPAPVRRRADPGPCSFTAAAGRRPQGAAACRPAAGRLRCKEQRAQQHPGEMRTPQQAVPASRHVSRGSIPYQGTPGCCGMPWGMGGGGMPPGGPM